MAENTEHDAEMIETDGDDAEMRDAEVDPLELLTQELAEANDKNLRLVAELRNVQQRAQREKEAALQFAEAGLATDMLPALDDLERTLASIGDEGAQQALAEGVRMVFDQLLKVLRDHGIEVIEAAGTTFDPEVHEAMLQQPSDEVPKGVVIQEVARGYRMKGRVLRSAKVIVSSGADAR